MIFTIHLLLNIAEKGGEKFIRLLRPEFVQSCAFPLSRSSDSCWNFLRKSHSDAFSPFGQQEDNADVIKATQILRYLNLLNVDQSLSQFGNVDAKVIFRSLKFRGHLQMTPVAV